jgi:alkanesulfonate monooxygenase SsuD/methylene tetrahydromethanopterin reductase-like flavin-dependent oxidoreductase (luciferase family)
MTPARPFRFGIKVATDPGDIPTREGWIALARKAEDLGYATFSVADHYINEVLPIAALMHVADACRRCHPHAAGR